MKDKSEEFMAACARTPAQIYEEHVNEVREENEQLESLEEKLVKQIDDYLYKALEPFADILIREWSGHLLLSDTVNIWWVPIRRSREDYDEAGGIRESVWREKKEQDLLKRWQRIKKSFHWELDNALQHIAKTLQSDVARLAARKEVIESFEI